MSPNTLSRRGLFKGGSVLAITAALPLPLVSRTAQAQTTRSTLLPDAEALLASLERAFTFQNLMMDAYATGSVVRLTQSYSDQALGATAFTYDNAVAIHAYLARANSGDLERAEVLGSGLLYAQAHNFPFNDGRFAQAYFVNTRNADGAFITPAAAPFYFYGSTVGDQAWAGMAFAQLYARTADRRYLSGALAVANWIVANTYSAKGAGGFSFGTTINPLNQSVPSGNGKSTEHNIDAYSFFRMLHKLTEGGYASSGMSWSALAQHALTFVLSTFNAAGPFFYTGTLPDQVTINPSPIPEDCQTWSYMATLQNRYRRTIDWALAHLETTDTAASPHTSLTGSETIHGLVFDTASLTTTADDPHAVWLEGTAHAAAALAARVLRGGDTLPALISDITTAISLLAQCALAQRLLGAGQTVAGHPIPTGLGLVAATGVLDTGFGYTYGPYLHIGATGWYILAGLAANPFQLGYRVID